MKAFIEHSGTQWQKLRQGYEAAELEHSSG
jgi:hypothetical protein